MGDFTTDTTTSYAIKDSVNGAYVVIEGEAKIGDQRLSKRDALNMGHP